MADLNKEDRARLRDDAKTLSDVSAMLARDGRFVVLPYILNDISENLNRVIRKSEAYSSRKGGVDGAGRPKGRPDDVHREDARDHVDAGI